ncbi:MAG: hypothetical protein JO290_03295 [Sphingomonadaceae bacterium]|nr:hypothetical protein [Sphingomonadaceae bacterium]
MKTAAAFNQADLARIFRAAKQADVKVRIEIERGRKIVILPVDAPGPARTGGSWDDVV